VVVAYDEMTAAIGVPQAAFVNAGVDGQGVPTTDLDPAVMLRVLAVNVVGAMLCAREAARRMVGAGSICINASVNGIRPEAGFADYNASKAAAISLARTMALEWSSRGIAVTALCPGYFPTPMTAPFLDDPDTLAEIVSQIPAGRIGRLDEVAAMASFLLSPDSAFATGGVFTIDGGRNV
jgi:NAD(P)-dependent dehydrogenase (short-subunit alcohol dehydrogenase family)